MNEVERQASRLQGRIIAIDGPAGAGKTTTARGVAARLGFTYIDTGAMYRALTYYALTRQVPTNDGARLAELADDLTIEFEIVDGVNRVRIDGDDITSEIRTPQVTRQVSEVSAHPGVRAAMVRKQKAFGQQGSIVAEGRDTTTVVFRDADLKIYLDASVETRARRRLLDLTAAGVETTFEEQLADIQRRDAHDSGRKHSPLTKAASAVTVDTTDLTIEEQIDRIVRLVLAAVNKP